MISLKSQQFAYVYKITICPIQTHISFQSFHVRMCSPQRQIAVSIFSCHNVLTKKTLSHNGHLRPSSPTKTHLRYFHATTCSPQRPTAITTDICDRFMSQCAQENQVSQRTSAEFQVSQRTFAMFWSNIASLKSHNGHLRVSSLTTYICGVFSFPTSHRLQLPDATFSNISVLATSRCTGAGWCFQFGANISWVCVCSWMLYVGVGGGSCVRNFAAICTLNHVFL